MRSGSSPSAVSIRTGTAEFAQDIEAVDAGEHDVEDDGVEVAVERGGEALGAGMNDGDVIAKRFEVVAQEAGEFFVVVDQQEAGTVVRLGSRWHGDTFLSVPW